MVFFNTTFIGKPNKTNTHDDNVCTLPFFFTLI